MIITAELSLYPLKDDYEESIISFIRHLKSNDDLKVLTHAMSTYVKGDNATVFSAISDVLEKVNESVETFSLVIKVIGRDLPVQKGFIEF